MEDKLLLTLKEFCVYTGWGMTTVRKIIKDKKWIVRYGNRIYIHKPLFDSYIKHCAEHDIPVK